MAVRWNPWCARRERPSAWAFWGVSWTTPTRWTARPFWTAAALLGEVVFHPYTSAGAFCPDYISQEKTNLIDRIRAQINDKRQYAQLRVVEEMCAGERFGVDKLGSEAAARRH